MKRHANTRSMTLVGVAVALPPRFRGAAVQLPHQQRATRAFTLVELLVVISIIGILMALTIPAVFSAITAAKDASIYAELKQLETACINYKEKFGEYPPDFAGLNDPEPAVRQAAQARVLRHLAKAFPRYPNSGSWTDFRNDVIDVNNGWGIDVNNMTPFTALTFWLGGRPNNGQFTGFSANQLNPFDGGTSRIGPFFEFDTNQLNPTNGHYWPKVATGTLTTGAIAYFRADNGGYFCGPNSQPVCKYADDVDGERIFPAIDYGKSDASNDVYAWVNSHSFQIFSAGLDHLYSTPDEGPVAINFFHDGVLFPDAPRGPYLYPQGANYDYDTTTGGHTFDDVTNFSEGRLENAIP